MIFPPKKKTAQVIFAHLGGVCVVL